MKTFGLIGGIGSGKSTVANMFCELGAARIDADEIGHEVLLLPPVKASLRQRWGDAVFDDDGRPDRRKIALIVFGPTEKNHRELEFLTSLMHPLIAEEVERQMRDWRRAGDVPLLFDAPLLLEAHWDHLVDRIVFVDAPREIRLERVRQRGWTETEFDARENVQYSVELKRRRADFIVDNSGFLSNTLDQIRKIWHNSSEV